jgi:uncharacterized damage-inducible protein DinB
MSSALSTKKIYKKIQGEIPDNFRDYFAKSGDEELFTAFQNQEEELNDLLNSISEKKSNYRYAEGKWTLKELLQHLIDTERIFAYRSLAFARHDPNTLPSFDENLYADMSNANDRTWEGLVKEFMVSRKSIVLLFDSFSEDALSAVGNASNYSAGVTTMGFVTIGHANHHISIIKERYLDLRN